VNETIETLFANFIVDGKKIPVEFMEYEGDSDTYITYQEIGVQSGLCADNMPQYEIAIYDFDIYSTNNYLKVLKELKKKLLENGFVWNEDSEDMFEHETRFFHKTTTFEIERR